VLAAANTKTVWPAIAVVEMVIGLVAQARAARIKAKRRIIDPMSKASGKALYTTGYNVWQSKPCDGDDKGEASIVVGELKAQRSAGLFLVA
jgi:hypothetical protein